jgi:hypothetical protein
VDVVFAVAAADVPQSFTDAGLAQAVEMPPVAPTGDRRVGDRHVVGQSGSHDHRGLEHGVRAPAAVGPELRRPPDIEAECEDELLIVNAARRALGGDEAIDRRSLQPGIVERRDECLGLQAEGALPEVEAERVAGTDADDARVR